jgi:acetyl-CoA acetyltransferase
MIPVYIAGIGMTEFDKSSTSLIELPRAAGLLALSNSSVHQVDATYLGAMNPAEFIGESNLASHLAEALGPCGHSRR